MTGLKFIRRRCNYTLSDFANELGVSRQILSEWENNSKPIPKSRKEQISLKLGISEDLLGEINNEQKDIIINKAMFKDADKEVYSYIPPYENEYGEHEKFTAYFMKEDFEPNVEKYAKAKKARNDMLSSLNEAFHGKDYTTQKDKTTAYNRDIRLFSLFLECYNAIWSRNTTEKMDAYHALENVLLATSSALNGYDEDIRPVNVMPSDVDLPHNNFHTNEIATEITRYLDLCKEYTKSVLALDKNDNKERAKSDEWKEAFEKLSLTDKILCVEKNWKERDCNVAEEVIYYGTF